MRIFSWATASDSCRCSSLRATVAKMCPEGTKKEKESSKGRQWPLQTSSMINAKGLLFLICQCFQRSLTYDCLQPCRSYHSSRWSGTSKTYYCSLLLRLLLSELQISPFATSHNALQQGTACFYHTGSMPNNVMP